MTPQPGRPARRKVTSQNERGVNRRIGSILGGIGNGSAVGREDNAAGRRCTWAHRCSTFARLNVVLILFSSISFFGYGLGCFLSAHLKREFDRYRLGSLRALVGGLQLCAAIGLVAGLSQPWMGRAAAAGLALMMLVAVGVRIRIKDSLPQTTPALFYLALNAYLCFAAY